jgi:hypothetical protein
MGNGAKRKGMKKRGCGVEHAKDLPRWQTTGSDSGTGLHAPKMRGAD